MLAISGLTSTAGAQSVKDIMGDKTGAYIYAQATDVSADDALSRAAEELSARVDTYIGANKLKTVNGAWREWIKRIINEKYGRTRVFLYLSVTDLKVPPRHNPNDAALQAGMASQEIAAQEIAMEAQSATMEAQSATMEAQSATMEAQSTTMEAQSAAMEAQSVAMDEQTAAMDAQTAAMDEQTAAMDEQTAAMDAQSTSIEEPSTGTDAGNAEAKTTMPDGAIGDLVRKIQSGKDIMSLLAKAKNMRVISLYGNTDSKYMPHAYLVYDDGGTTRVYSPIRKDGTRLSFPDGASITSPAGRLVAWFLKK